MSLSLSHLMSNDCWTMAEWLQQTILPYTTAVFTRHFLQRVLECTKHISVEACLKVNCTEDRLQSWSRWEEKQWVEKNVGLWAVFKEWQGQHFVFKFHLLPLGFSLLFLIIGANNLAASTFKEDGRFSISGSPSTWERSS